VATPDFMQNIKYRMPLTKVQLCLVTIVVLVCLNDFVNRVLVSPKPLSKSLVNDVLTITQPEPVVSSAVLADLWIMPAIESSTGQRNGDASTDATSPAHSIWTSADGDVRLLAVYAETSAGGRQFARVRFVDKRPDAAQSAPQLLIVKQGDQFGPFIVGNISINRLELKLAGQQIVLFLFKAPERKEIN